MAPRKSSRRKTSRSLRHNASTFVADLVSAFTTDMHHFEEKMEEFKQSVIDGDPVRMAVAYGNVQFALGRVDKLGLVVQGMKEMPEPTRKEIWRARDDASDRMFAMRKRVYSLPPLSYYVD